MHGPFYIDDGTLFKWIESMSFCTLLDVAEREETLLTRFCLHFIESSRDGLTCFLIALAPHSLEELDLAVLTAHVFISR